MFLENALPLHGAPLDPRDAETLSVAGARRVARHLALRPGHAPTPLVPLPALAAAIGVAELLVKDEGQRLGLGSFKALGGAYAVALLCLEEAGARLGRPLDAADLADPAVRAVAATLTFACATDGNHGRSVAQGAALVGARSVVFVHGGVSDARVAAIAAFGAEIVRVAGTYDDSVEEAATVGRERGWTIVSDTSWPGYERIPGLVMQGYTALLREALDEAGAPPTHVFIQAGVGGIAATLAGHLALLFGRERPRLVVVEPDRAACLFASARAGAPVPVEAGEPTVMAMLECYAPSLVAWRVLERAADAFMLIEDEEAVAAMSRLARPLAGDPVLVAGESGGAGLAGLLRAARDPRIREALGLGAHARVLLVNTEGATDPDRFREITGLDPAALRHESALSIEP